MAVKGQLHNRISLNVTIPAGSFSSVRRQNYGLVLPPDKYLLLFVLQHSSKEIILYIAKFGYRSRPERFIDKHLATNLPSKYNY